MAKIIAPKPLPDAEDNKSNNGTLKYLATAGSILAGLGYTRHFLRDSAYDNLKKRGVFDDIREQHAQKLHRVIDGPLGEIQRAQNDTKGSFPEVFKELYQERRVQTTQRLKDVGVLSIRDEWTMSHKTQRRSAIVMGISVSTILLGATLTIISAFSKDKAAAKPESDLLQR